MRKRLGIMMLAAALLLVGVGCGNGEEVPTETLTPPPVEENTTSPSAPEETEEVYSGPYNPLTGEPIAEGAEDLRPVAVMLNNLKTALPQQGNGQADIIYEVLAEGGITRMLAVYQDISQVGNLASIRSARPYYIELALGHDAVYVHAGGSPDAYSDLSAWDVDHIDGVRGTYSYSGSGVFWRDANRISGHSYGYEHSLLTSGEKLTAVLEGDGFTLEHPGYDCGLTFREDGTPEGGSPASVVTVPFSDYKTGVFRYDSQQGVYLVEEYGQAYVDGNDGAQVAVTNVLVLQTACRVLDSAGRLSVDLTQGEGWYACGGSMIPILWSKGDRNSPLRYTDLQGNPLELGAGKSYVSIIPTSQTVTAS